MPGGVKGEKFLLQLNQVFPRNVGDHVFTSHGFHWIAHFEVFCVLTVIDFEAVISVHTNFLPDYKSFGDIEAEFRTKQDTFGRFLGEELWRDVEVRVGVALTVV